MSVNKGIGMYTKLDKGLRPYLKTLEKYVGKIDKIIPANTADWGYDDGLSLRNGIDYLNKVPVKSKVYVSLDNCGSFYLKIHNRDGKPAIAELSDWGSDSNSYNVLFSKYFKAGRALGNTVCYMCSENEKDAQLRYKGFDKDGHEIGIPVLNRLNENIGDKKSIDAFAKKELGLSVVGNFVRVPDVYLGIADKGFNRPMKGFVKKINRKEDFKLNNHYAIAYYDKDKKQYRKFGEVSIPLDIVVSKDFEKKLADVVQTEDFQNKLKESALCLDEYYKNVYDRKGNFEHNYDLKKNGYKLQEELENACNSVFFQDLKNQNVKKQENAFDKLTIKQKDLVVKLQRRAKELDIRVKQGVNKGKYPAFNSKAKDSKKEFTRFLNEMKELGVYKGKASSKTKQEVSLANDKSL